MAGLLDDEEILIHPLVIGEIALGNLRNRAEIMDRLRQMLRFHLFRVVQIRNRSRDL